eukprot:m.206736 g.206736  ORF g.206736 m.206736 type:complete len:169 (+) comp17109_c1_seq1:91-597(+)
MASYASDHGLLEVAQALARQVNDGRGQAADGEARDTSNSNLEDLLARLFDVIGLSETEQSSSKKPPTSTSFISDLDIVEPTKTELAEAVQCPICMAAYQAEDDLHELPCEHVFHVACIVPWMEQACVCPLCRYELPTDDQAYEEKKQEVKRKEESEAARAALHNSMFG